MTITAHGADGSWIVKFPADVLPGLAENEYSMLELARRVGFDVPPTRLIDASGIRGIPLEFTARGTVFAIRRFDRTEGGGRIHAEDFSQVFGEFEKYDKHSYANIADLLNRRTSYRDLEAFVKLVAFSAIVGNGDMHTKNVSLIYRDGRTPQLAPVYDIVSGIVYDHPDLDHNLGLSFGRNKHADVYKSYPVESFAERARISARDATRWMNDLLEAAREAWKSADDLPLLDEHRSIIGKRIETFRPIK